MRIRIRVPFGGYKVGQEFDWADGMARVMIARRLIEQVEERSKAAAPVEAAVVETRSETAAIDSRLKKRHQR